MSFIMENITDKGIYLWTSNYSCAELNVCPSDMLSEIDVTLQDPVFWFCRLKAKVEGRGEGTKLMDRLIDILDAGSISVINGVNPYGSMSMGNLKKFYKKYGFYEVGRDIMVRKPTILD